MIQTSNDITYFPTICQGMDDAGIVFQEPLDKSVTVFLGIISQITIKIILSAMHEEIKDLFLIVFNLLITGFSATEIKFFVQIFTLIGKSS